MRPGARQGEGVPGDAGPLRPREVLVAVLAARWEGDGIVVKYWSNNGQIMVKYWSDTVHACQMAVLEARWEGRG